MAREWITGFLAGSRFIEWTTLAREKDKFTVAKFRRVDEEAQTPPVEAPNAGPAPVETPPTLAARVKKAGVDLKGSITACLPSESALLRVISLPAVPDEEMAGMVGLQLDKLSPFPVEDMVFSHEVLAEAGGNRQVLVAAVRKTLAEALEQELHAAGILPNRMDLTIMAWWRLLKDGGHIPDAGRHVAVVDAGEEVMVLVASNGTPVAFRTMGAAASGTPAGIQDLTDEVGHTLMTLELEHGSAESISATVWQKDVLVRDLASALADACRSEVAVNAISSLPPVSEGAARRGAADGIRLDLTPSIWRTEQKDRLFRKKLLLLAEVLLGVWVVAVGGILGGTYAMEWSMARLRVTQEEWKKPANEVKELRARVRLIQKYTDFNYTAIECLRETAGAMPDGVRMTGFDYKRGEKLRITGLGDSVNQVYDFKNRLDGSALFKGLDIALASGPLFDKKSGKQQFEIDVKLPGGEK